MPHAVMASIGVSSVQACTDALQGLLRKAKQIKPTARIEPALTSSDFDDDIGRFMQIASNGGLRTQQANYASIETAFRNTFYDLLASASINDPAFSEIWNLLDIIQIFSDREQCEPGLLFWLVEELLESQTIEGCKKVFDYLDSRRERITEKHWKSKHLIVLRACTELLRRLSRAEDTVFCGRVFIFLFQSFPLGDKSAVNLRGEFHVENSTIYDATPLKPTQNADAMELDGALAEEVKAEDQEKADTIVTDVESTTKVSLETKITKPDGTEEESKKTIDADTLYPIFWSLQDYFSRPTKLFDPAHLASFREGLEMTLTKFKEVQKEVDSRGSGRNNEDQKQDAKRKWEGEDESSSSFNPKYLTSRDLFELEISDLAFRRHILVQALILSEFLLSQTPKAKAKLQSLKNKSVIYDFTLEEKEAQWATHIKSEIANYLQQGNEGKFYYRMVDTVLSRDKNWVYWKAEGCPPFQRPSVSASEYSAARTSASKATTNKRLRSTPMGSLDLSFLTDLDGSDGMEKLKGPERYAVPALESFERPIADDEFEMEMAKTEEEKSLVANARASKIWRALRIASKGKFGLFDKLEDGGNLGILFRPPPPSSSSPREEEKLPAGASTATATVTADGESTATMNGTPDARQQEGVMVDGAKASGANDVTASSSASLPSRPANVDGAAEESSTLRINGAEVADATVSETAVK